MLCQSVLPFVLGHEGIDVLTGAEEVIGDELRGSRLAETDIVVEHEQEFGGFALDRWDLEGVVGIG